jgi:hypothetical protein
MNYYELHWFVDQQTLDQELKGNFSRVSVVLYVNTNWTQLLGVDIFFPPVVVDVERRRRVFVFGVFASLK